MIYDMKLLKMLCFQILGNKKRSQFVSNVHCLVISDEKQKQIVSFFDAFSFYPDPYPQLLPNSVTPTPPQLSGNPAISGITCHALTNAT